MEGCYTEKATVQWSKEESREKSNVNRILYQRNENKTT